MAWHYPLTFDLQGALLHLCPVSLGPKRQGSGDLLVLYSNGSLPFFVLAMTITLRCLQKTNTGYLPCFHFRGQIGS